MDIMFLRSRSHVKASMVLTRGDHLYKNTFKYYVKGYFNDTHDTRTHVLLLVFQTYKLAIDN